MTDKVGFNVWCPDLGRTEEDALFYAAEWVAIDDFTSAAERYAEVHCGYKDDPFTAIEVHVRDTGTKVVHKVTIEVEYEPVFNATKWHKVPVKALDADAGEPLLRAPLVRAESDLLRVPCGHPLNRPWPACLYCKMDDAGHLRVAPTPIAICPQTGRADCPGDHNYSCNCSCHGPQGWIP